MPPLAEWACRSSGICRRFIVDIGDQRRIEQFFRLLPERISGIPFSLCIDHQRCDQLQDVFLRVGIGKGIVFHALFEVDRIEDLQLITFCQEQVATGDDDIPFCQGSTARKAREIIFFWLQYTVAWVNA